MLFCKALSSHMCLNLLIRFDAILLTILCKKTASIQASLTFTVSACVALATTFFVDHGGLTALRT